MSLYDTFKQSQNTPVPAPQPVQQSKPGVLSKVGSFLGSLFGGGQAPSQPPPAAPTPSPEPVTPPSSVYESFKSSQSTQKAPTGSTSVYDQFKNKSVPSPYFSKTEPSGAVIGFSGTEKDTSGRPFFAYRNPGDTATTTDKTRVASTFDPTLAQPLTHDQYYNPRASNLRAEFLDKLGITPSDQLDHAIALTVGGSNDVSNLRAIPTAENQAAGQVELQLAERLKAGKISYLDAQVEDAKSKGVAVPWVPPEYRQKNVNPWDQFKNYVSDLFAPKKEVVPATSPSVHDYFKNATLDTSKIGSTVQIAPPASTETAKSTPAVGNPNEPSAVENLLNPKAETPFPTLPFATEEEQKKAGNLVGPPIVTGPAKVLFSIPAQILQAIPRGLVTLKEEFSPSSIKSTLAGTAPETKKLGPIESRLYGSPEYKTVNRDIQDRLKNGNGALASYLGAISGKVMDIAFPAAIAASAFRTTAALLSQGSDFSTVEAWKTMGSPKNEAELQANYRALARQLHPDMTGGTDVGIKTINQAKDILDENGIPAALDLYKQKGAQYAEWLGRETKLTDPILSPNLKLKTDVSGKALPFKQLAAPSEESQLKDTIANSQAFDVQDSIKNGEIPRSDVYASGDTVKPEFAKGRIDDIAEKLDGYKPGLGDRFRGMVDANNVTMKGDVPEELVKTANNLIDLSNGKSATIDISTIKQAQYYPTLGKDEPLSSEELANFGEENPEMIQAIKDGKTPPIPVRALSDGKFEPDGDGANRLLAYKFLGIKDVPVEVTSTDPGIDIFHASPAFAYKKIAGTSVKDIAAAQRDQVAGELSSLSSDDFIDSKGKVNIDLYGDSEDILSRIEKGRDTPEDLRRAAEILSTLGKEPAFLKAAPGINELAEPGDMLSTKLLGRLEGRTSVSPQFISDLSNAADLKQPERDLVREVLKEFKGVSAIPVKEFADAIKSRLLPLERTSATIGDKSRGISTPRYEGVNLPPELRGQVKDYSENVYQSPVPTTAGDVHFNSIDYPNYFAHTRVEDLPRGPFESADSKGGHGTTRRIIEIQSDLFQKGRFENEASLSPELMSNEAKIAIQKKGRGGELTADELAALNKDLETRGASRAKQIKAIEPYRNTWYERVLREEISKAAKDAKNTLLVPTGNTAMKIEGLGDMNRGRFLTTDSVGDPMPLEVRDLKIGKEINGNGGNWIITDVLGDGKFNAVPLQTFAREGYTSGELGGTVAQKIANQLPRLRAAKETFDISGKIDTNNPIYRFYEKEIGRYLKNAYNATHFTDAKGVTWWKVDIKPEHGTKPVNAFKLRSAGSDVERLAKKQGVEFNTAVTEYKKLVSQFFNDKEVSFLFPKTIDSESAWGRTQIRKAFQNPLVEVVQHDGKISDAVLYHESFHVFLRQFMSVADREALLKAVSRNPLAKIKMNLVYKGLYGSDTKLQAEEYAADMFANFMKGKNVPPAAKTFFQKILDLIRGWIRKLTGLQDTFDRMLSKDRSFVRTESRTGVFEKKAKTPSIFNAKNMNKDLSVEEELDREAEDALNVINQQHATELIDLEEKGNQLEIEREALNNNPARMLSQYVAKSGGFKGKLPEVTGKPGSKFGQRGDDIITELGFKDSEEARAAWEKYSERKQVLDKKVKDFMESKRELYQKFKEDKEKYSNATTHPAGRYDMEITESNGGVVPPVVRGGIQAPEMDLTKFKDIAVPRLGRDTMERNIEKVAGPYADELKNFVIEPVRVNEVDKVKFLNSERRIARAKMKELGLKVRSNEDDLIQRYGEGYLSIEQLRDATPKWKEVMSAADFYRKTYDRLINDWNEKRVKFGYSVVPKRSDYFRHFNDINQFTNQFGILRSESQLPTEIAGMTENFKPGKPFSTAELHRIGNRTSYSAIRGMDNYLDSISRQMFHIDSIQRGRALEKYIRKVARENKMLKLPNFVQNVEEWTNLVSGKAAKLDRAIESVAGRPVMKFMLGLSRVLGRNIVVGNISVAMTHLVSIPLNLATVDKVPFMRGMFSTLVSPFRAEPITMVDGLESSFLTRRYPEKYIMPTTFDKVTDTLSFLFHMTDVFKSKLAVASKYYEALDRGLSKEAAMHEADTYAGRIVGDYSVGNRPNLMNTHTTQLVAQFQLGVNDGVSVLLHDIPHWENKNKWKIATRLAQFFIFSYLFNKLYKQIRGSGKGIDPIDAGLTLAGLNDEGKGQDFVSRLKLAGADLAGELPFTSAVAGSYPLAQAFPLLDVFAGNKTWQDFTKQLIADFASPVGGGTQAKKTIEGVQAYNQGYTTTATGKYKAPVEQTPANLLKGIIFGKTGFSGVAGQSNETTRLLGLITSKTATSQQEAESLHQQFKKMSPAQAKAAWDALHAKDARLADQVATIATEEREGMTLNERLIKQLGVTTGQRATYIYNQLQKLSSDAERKTMWDRYERLKIISPTVSKQLQAMIKK